MHGNGHTQYVPCNAMKLSCPTQTCFCGTSQNFLPRTQLFLVIYFYVNSAQSLYTTCVKHLEKPLQNKSEECQHYILTFHLHLKLKSQPNTMNWIGVSETHKFHSIGNTNTNAVYFNNFACCCIGCLHGEEPCSNTVPRHMERL